MIALSFFFLVAIISVSSYNKRETKDLRALEWLSVSESNIKDDSFTNFEEYYIKSLNNFETRNVRAVSNDGGSASSGSGISDDDLNDCAYSIEATAFSLVSTSLHTLVTQCTSSLQSDDQYNFTVTLTNSNFTTHSQDSDLLYADKFELGKKYKVHVIANCSLDLCDDPLVMLSLNVSVTNYTNRLLPYGKILKDNKMSNVDDEAVTVLVNSSKPIPIFSGKYRKIYVRRRSIHRLLSIHFTMHSSILLSIIHPLYYPFIHFTIHHSSIILSIHPFYYPSFIHYTIHSSILLSIIHPLYYPFIHYTIHHSSILLSIHPLYYPFIHFTIHHSSIILSIHPFYYPF